MADRLGGDFHDLLRGQRSLGAFIARDGYKVVPSPTYPDPGSPGNYYSGGYIVRRHGSRCGGIIDAIQIESPEYLRNAENGTAYAKSLARAILDFYSQN